MISERSFSVTKTARYYTSGKPSGKIKSVLYVLHGYGQLAKGFLENFNVVNSEDKLIIAPEGLNKFYFRGLGGNVGASWMTKEDRENDIYDYINYLNKVHVMVMEDLKNNNCKINILGFSQGCHTAVRWLANTGLNVNSLFLWSGTFPDDIDFTLNLDYWKSLAINTVIGNKDRFIDKSIILAQHKKLKELNIDVELVNFDGDHKIDQQVLINLIN